MITSEFSLDACVHLIADHLPTSLGVQPAERRREQATFILPNRATLARDHRFILLLLTSSFNQGLPQRFMFLHSVLFLMSFSVALTYSISSFTTSRRLVFGLLLFLFPCNSISITLPPKYSWSILMTCPYHLSLPSLIFNSNCSTITAPLMYSCLILSFLVTP